MASLGSIKELQARIGKSIIEQQPVIDSLILGLLANGNLLLEGLPGLAKTRAVSTWTACLNRWSRAKERRTSSYDSWQLVIGW